MYLVLFFVSTAIQQMLTFLFSAYSSWFQGLIYAALATAIYLIWDMLVHRTRWAAEWAHQRIPARILREAEISIAELRSTKRLSAREEAPAQAPPAPQAIAVLEPAVKESKKKKKSVLQEPIATIYSHAAPQSNLVNLH